MTQRSTLPPNVMKMLESPQRILPPILTIITCFKILLMPTYRSTDFDVHRNWLAITKNLPLSEWYFDNVNGTTVHTLDYPPLFAFFEWMLSNNPITSQILPANDRCLDLLPDDDNHPSDACVIFQRSTVIISDLVLWAGAYTACKAMYFQKPIYLSTLSFLFIVLNPGLIWLDHIHFQYNGMLIGLLLGSLGLLMHGNNVAPHKWAYDFYHLGGAALFAILLNFKHLYLTLAPLYFFYLLKGYCFSNRRFSFQKFFMLAFITSFFLIIPWIPFVRQQNPKEQMKQIVTRLFPFGRGLVHDYWAANVWAMYLLADKVLRFISTRISLIPLSGLPEPSPMVCAIALFLCQIPALQIASGTKSNVKLIQAVVYCSFCAFMLAYHVHEKAIMTTLIPLTLLIKHPDLGETNKLLFWHVSSWGLLGLFPLLFRPVELLFKIISYLTYLATCSLFLNLRQGRLQLLSWNVILVVIIILEVLPIHGRWEFLPLLITSTICSVGLISCWVVSLVSLLTQDKTSNDS